ncbi:hypothetical protein A2767_00255 [Candidatus Roizmanbacteria bacterium RIFCSPHIGHO2_01_FULL_35_10]|uniref:Methyltransferase type 12 domain-containing protein n=1 Tax=Candidatus Roizmanbacteria bacterium RIFCSPLOWO2_01_FULL_35_13 TaxID=1802055 RepID=A0A1F7IHD2_9BACT|nr:MAG: hypothetical protein A2767_00255 [Candidatus Roizmanbacteria bacterium RIFCSPHIGHO2_01_FULL_35_10]OGK42780.1 MAG: hypothetical protein A3A74_01025 [Candidatus Roizmanbacteria bacterium RIFCSPLOWO2_01_FULL_35_13]
MRIEKAVQIYECLDCQLGFVEQNVSSLTRSYKDDTNGFYDFEGYREKENKLKKRFGSLIEEIIKYKKSGNVLDVGAGFGLFSSILTKNGKYQIDILEPNVERFYLRFISYNFYKTTLAKFLTLTKLRDRGDLSIKRQGKLYDVIILMDVIEHLENPLVNLKKLKLLLAPGGILIIQTPNYKSLMARICKDWAWWMIEDHKFFFSPKSLQKILYKAGFKSEYFMTYEDWYDFKKNLDGNFTGIKNNPLKKLIKGLFFSLFFPFYFLFRKMIWRLGYGGLMFVIAKKDWRLH